MASQYLNGNEPVPLSSQDANGNYNWMGISCGLPSNFTGQTNYGPVNAGAQLVYNSFNSLDAGVQQNNNVTATATAAAAFTELNAAVTPFVVSYVPLNANFAGAANGRITDAAGGELTAYYSVTLQNNAAAALPNVQVGVSVGAAGAGVPAALLSAATTIPGNASAPITISGTGRTADSAAGNTIEIKIRVQGAAGANSIVVSQAKLVVQRHVAP